MDFAWDSLSKAEQRLVEATIRGEIADLGPEKPPVRAELIRALLLQLPSGADGDKPYPVQLAGVRLCNATIDGELRLRACRGVGDRGLPALSLEHCVIPGRIDLRHARIAQLSIAHSRVGKVLAIAAHIDGQFDFSGVSANDPDGVGAWVNASASVIEGEVLGVGAHLITPSRGEASKPWSRWYALRLSDARIAGAVNLAGFEAVGGVSLSAARIEGDVWLSRARLIAGESRALNARSANVEGLVMMIDGCWATGEVSFSEAIVHGRFSCTEGAITGTPVNELSKGRKDRALVRIDGLLDLRGAEFRSSIELGGGMFNNEGEWAINAAGIRVGGDFRLRSDRDHRDDATYIIGGLRLEGAQISGEVIWDNLFLEGPGPATHARPQDARAANDGGRIGRSAARAPRIKLTDARIGSALKAYSMGVVLPGKREAVHAVIDLTGARCATLDDDLENDAWGQREARTWLMLEDFVYGRLAEDVKFAGPQRSNNDRWQKRRKWLHDYFERFGSFHPQPYQLLARFYADAGWFEDMHRCLEREQWRRLRHEARSWETIFRPLSVLFGVTAGFGHAASRLWVTLILYWFIGACGVHYLNQHGLLVIDTSYMAQSTSSPRPPLIGSADEAQSISCGNEIEPAIYAIDVMIPLIDLQQETKCEPGFAAGVAGNAHELALLRWLKAGYAILGALLAGAAVFTLSGGLRRRADPLARESAA